MKVVDKIKNFFTKKHPDGTSSFAIGKIAGFTLITISNLSAVTLGTIAWFNLASRDSRIDIVSGDLNVEVRKISAYKYVYPYYQGSNEFIDYDSEGTVKKYVLEDNTLEFDDENVKDIEITSDDATITLGTQVGGSNWKTTDPQEASSNKVCIPEVTPPAVFKPDFRYYLVGDGLFNGVDNPWSLTDGYAFALRDNVTADTHAFLDNIVISAGSSFRLVETMQVASVYNYLYFPLDSINDGSPFRIVDSDDDGSGDSLLCLRSGIYNFTYSPNELNIELRTIDDDGEDRKDIAVISNNSLDPTKISIDYAGSVNHTTYPTIESYMRTAIYNQNTTMIIDVELNFKNPNEITAGLRVNRKDASNNSIYRISGKYQDTTNNLVGYVDEQNRNPVRASDFFNYHAVFTKTPYANANAVWAAMHLPDAISQKFINGESYDSSIDCTLNLKEKNDSTTIPAVNPESGNDQIYHCYIAIEYDHEYNTYFLDKNRLGKTYLLDRDFGFYFYGVQKIEE